MTQPPYSGQNPPPEGPQHPPGQPNGEPEYPPAVDPYSSPPSAYSQPGQPDLPAAGYPQQQPACGQPYPTSGQPAYGQPYPTSGQPAYGQPYPTSGQPAYGQPYPTSGQPGPSTPFPPPPGHLPPPGTPPPPISPPPYQGLGSPAPKKRRGVLIAAAVAVVLLLCAGGSVSAWLLLRNTEKGDGAAEPVAAVTEFLRAVYTEKNAERAADLVCAEARDEEAIGRKVDEVKKYDETYERPRFEWDAPKVESRDDEKAVVAVTLTMTTADEKIAEQQLKLTVVQKTGWWVCDVS